VNSGWQIVIYPGTYTENITISQNNLSIVGTNNEIGGIINLNGNITVSSNSTSIRLCSLTFNNLTISGSANVYLKDCNINGNISKSGGGYFSVNNIVCNLISTISITGAGNCNFSTYSSLGASFTVNNSSAIINISNCLQMANINVIAGICSVNNTVLYATNSSVYAINSSVGTFVYVSNLSCVNGNDNLPAKLNLLGFYSITNSNYNRSTSILTGTNLGRISYFDALNVGGGTLVDTSSIQTVQNKTMSSMKLSANQIITNTDKTINFIDSNDTIVNLNSVQTMTNKTLTDCAANTQLTTDNSTKIATTAFVHLLSAYPISSNFTTIIGGTSTNPTLGTSQKNYYYVIGKILYVNYGIVFDGTGSNGTGTMTLSLPSGFTVDTTKINTDNNNAALTNANSFYSATKIGYGNLVISYNLIATIYSIDTNKILLFFTNYINTSSRLTPSNHNNFNINISVPIQWIKYIIII